MALLALAYAYFGAFGLQALSQRIRKPNARARLLRFSVTGLFFTPPAIYARPIFGAWGQINPVDNRRLAYRALIS